MANAWVIWERKTKEVQKVGLFLSNSDATNAVNRLRQRDRGGSEGNKTYDVVQVTV